MTNFLTPQVRTWIYGVAIAALPLGITYGVIDDNEAVLWAAVAGAVFVPTLAVSHVDRKTTPEVIVVNNPEDDVEFDNPDSPQFEPEPR